MINPIITLLSQSYSQCLSLIRACPSFTHTHSLANSHTPVCSLDFCHLSYGILDWLAKIFANDATIFYFEVSPHFSILSILDDAFFSKCVFYYSQLLSVLHDKKEGGRERESEKSSQTHQQIEITRNARAHTHACNQQSIHCVFFLHFGATHLFILLQLKKSIEILFSIFLFWLSIPRVSLFLTKKRQQLNVAQINSMDDRTLNNHWSCICWSNTQFHDKHLITQRPHTHSFYLVSIFVRSCSLVGFSPFHSDGIQRGGSDCSCCT